jgi:hypothetical protein
MALFESSKDLFELITQPASQPGSAFQKTDQLLSFGGKPVVIVEEWPDQKVAGVKSTLEFTLRKDTMIVISVVAAVLVILAFLAGRATMQDKTTGPETKPQPKTLPADVFVPNPAPQKIKQAPQAAQKPVTSPQGGAGVISRRALPGTHELQVVTTRNAKARAVVKYLNSAPGSPIFARRDLEAYVRGQGTVRIRGFKKMDKDVQKSVETMKDPTRSSGRFRGTMFYKTRR